MSQMVLNRSRFVPHSFFLEASLSGSVKKQRWFDMLGQADQVDVTLKYARRHALAICDCTNQTSHRPGRSKQTLEGLGRKVPDGV